MLTFGSSWKCFLFFFFFSTYQSTHEKIYAVGNLSLHCSRFDFYPNTRVNHKNNSLGKSLDLMALKKMVRAILLELDWYLAHPLFSVSLVHPKSELDASRADPHWRVTFLIFFRYGPWQRVMIFTHKFWCSHMLIFLISLITAVQQKRKSNGFYQLHSSSNWQLSTLCLHKLWGLLLSDQVDFFGSA